MVLTLSRRATSIGLRFIIKKYKLRRCLDAHTTSLYEGGGTTCIDKLGLLPLNSLDRQSRQSTHGIGYLGGALHLSRLDELQTFGDSLACLCQ